MTTIDFITELYYCIADRLTQVDKEHKHPQVELYPSEVVPGGVVQFERQRSTSLLALANTGLLPPSYPIFLTAPGGHPACFAWSAHTGCWGKLLGVIDSYGIELLHPRRVECAHGH